MIAHDDLLPDASVALHGSASVDGAREWAVLGPMNREATFGRNSFEVSAALASPCPSQSKVGDQNKTTSDAKTIID